MNIASLPPFAAEVETEEEEAAYAAWLRAKVQEAADDPRPGIPHDQVMAEMDTWVAQAKANFHKQAA